LRLANEGCFVFNLMKIGPDKLGHAQAKLSSTYVSDCIAVAANRYKDGLLLQVKQAVSVIHSPS